MRMLYRILTRLAVLLFVGTALVLGVFMIANIRETVWSNVHWGIIFTILFGPAAVIWALAWIVKPPPSTDEGSSYSPVSMRDKVGPQAKSTD